MDLFELSEELDRMHRRPDHDTSIRAAKGILSLRSVLQAEIHAVLKIMGPATDGELEKLERFSNYAPSTVRKRRSELFQGGRAEWTGEKRGGMKVWRAA